MTDNDELVERVAIEMAITNRDAGPMGYGQLSYWGKFARAALSALRPGDTYNDMMWVPVEPTEAMLVQGGGTLHDKRPSELDCRKTYAKMLQALKGDE